jgi:hypothetical protein
MNQLPEGYFIQMNKEKQLINKFADEASLTAYLLEENMRDYLYFGKDFLPGDPQLSKAAIVGTVMKHFELLYPTYELILQDLKI